MDYQKDIKIKQEQIAKKYYEKHPLFNVEGVDIEFLDKIGKNIQIIDYKTKPNRYFDIFVKLNILQTNYTHKNRQRFRIEIEDFYGYLTFVIEPCP